MKKYDFPKIEKKWQKRWLEEKIFRARDDSKKQKYYQLETFPYPSAAGLHVGHPKGYIAEDIHARYMRMRGKEVLYTMGWDAFGLPTENYAIKVGKSPKEVAVENVKNFKRQVQMFGLSYDWDREINTSDPEYYKWTQWLFVQLFKKGLAYRAKAKVNWCPKDQTVLANEQVVNGKCERCGSDIEERDMEQWFLKITDYAERLLADLKGLDWPSATIKRQEDWIGKSEGALLKFALKNMPGQPDEKHFVEVFTTRPDTLFGATFMVISPELAEKWIDVGWQAPEEVKKYVKKGLGKTELDRMENVKEKTGVATGVYAVNPANKEEIPVWIADYVLGSYGTGAIMAVPAHDERDFEFAKKFKLTIKTVIEPCFIQTTEPGKIVPDKPFVERQAIMAVIKHWKENKYLGLKWKKVDWRTVITGGIEPGQTAEESAVKEIAEETGYLHPRLVKDLGVNHSKFYHVPKQENRSGHFRMLYFELMDDERREISRAEQEIHDVLWLTAPEMSKFLSPASHQHAWFLVQNPEYVHVGDGTLANSGKFDGMDSEKAKWEITKFVGGERKVQYRIRDWSVSRQRYWGVPIPMIDCPKCGTVPVPDKDLPVLLPDLAEGPESDRGKNYRPKGKPPLASSEEFINVKCPKCAGDAKRDPETLDTFVDSSWYYLRYTDPHNDKAVFDKTKAKHWLPADLYVIGAEHAVLHLLYSRFITKFLQDEGYLSFGEPFLKLRHQGLILGEDGQKMSKSKGNVVNPDELIEEFGADTVRVYEMFMGPFENGAPWDPKGMLGAERFLKRFWNYAVSVIPAKAGIHAPESGDPKAINSFLHRTIKKIGEDIEGFKFNTAISTLMILLNELEKSSAKLQIANCELLIKIVHPFAPHMAQELWELSGNKTILDFEPWPAYDPKLIEEEKFTLVIQVNGRVRDTIEVGSDVTEEQAKEIALASEKVKNFVGDSALKKVIYITKKLVNIVI